MLKVTLENKSTVHINRVAPGSTVTVEADKHGTPKQKVWRDRLRDSKIDGAIVKVPKTKTPKKKEDK